MQAKRGEFGDKKMKKRYCAYIKKSQGYVWLLIAILLLILLTQVLGDNRIQRPQRPRSVPVSEAQKQGIARGLAASYGIGPFKPSLEMKEYADFLLTPALLVQEALSDDVVITYPTE